MISRLQIYYGTGTDPWHNLAVEQYLLENGPEDGCILYLWQNQNTVVIGRNQNAWKECRVTLLEEEGGRLARRLSGGGAVFHDTGNLNFTFLLPRADYDVRRQLEVICAACRSLGIPAEISGRNDLLAGGRKFSGNAFFKHGNRAYHHGTLLIHADMDKLSRYLSPSKAKLAAKGVDSVRSRVSNLREFVPDLTCETMAHRLVEAVQQVYGLTAETLTDEMLDWDAIAVLREHNASREWRFGDNVPATFFCEGAFPWGGVRLELQVDRGMVTRAAAYTDAMEWELADQLQEALTDCAFSLPALQANLRTKLTQPDIREDLCRMLAEQEI